MKTELIHEILDLLESPELNAHLRNHKETLTDELLAQIVAGAPIALTRKAKLLRRLERDGAAVSEYMSELERLLRIIEQFDPVKYVLMIHLMQYDLEKRAVTTVDGPFPVRDLLDAQRAIWEYNEACLGETPFPYFWRLEFYDMSEHPKHDGFRCPVITCICAPSGEIQYVVGNRRKTSTPSFGEACPDLDLSVPYRPGDILHIDCRPYVPFDTCCLITEVGDGCCGVQCIFPCANHELDFGALKRGQYFDVAHKSPQYLSPLYRAKIQHGPVPERFSVLEELAQFLRAMPESGRIWRESGDFAFDTIVIQ